MDNSNRKNDEHSHNDPIQFTDLDALQPSQHQSINKLTVSLSQALAKPSIRLTLLAISLLILMSLVLPPFIRSLSPVPIHPASPTPPGHILTTNASSTPLPPDLLTLSQRPLHLPTLSPGSPCPTTPERTVNPQFGIVQGDGPVYPTIGAETISSPAIFHYVDAQHFGQGTDTQGWGGNKVLWLVNTQHYQGFILIRGHQLDGPHQIRFDTPDNPQLTPQLVINTQTEITANGWGGTIAYTRLQAPGCYAYQIDGTTFSSTTIFQAAVQ